MRLLTALCVLVATPATSLAIPIQWELDGSLLQSGTASGSFVYDADTATFSDIMLRTSADSPSGGLLFTQFAGRGLFSDQGLNFLQPNLASPFTVGFQLNGIFTSLLTNQGGVLIVNPFTDVANFAEFNCIAISGCAEGSGSNVSNWDPRARNTLTGAALVSVPEPGTLALFAIGLAALGWRTRRRRHGG